LFTVIWGYEHAFTHFGQLADDCGFIRVKEGQCIFSDVKTKVLAGSDANVIRS
jgi:hypothetical protein